MSRGLYPQFCPRVSILLGPQFCARVSILLVLSSVHVSVFYWSSVLSTCQSSIGPQFCPRVSLLLVLSSVHVSVFYWVLSSVHVLVFYWFLSSVHVSVFSSHQVSSISIYHPLWPAGYKARSTRPWLANTRCLFIQAISRACKTAFPVVSSSRISLIMFSLTL